MKQKTNKHNPHFKQSKNKQKLERHFIFIIPLVIVTGEIKPKIK